MNKILALTLVVGLWLPMLINHSGLVKKLFIYGVELPAKKNKISWMDGTAQEEFENKLMLNSVARTYLLKIRNQYQYSFFKRINATDIYEYNNYLFRFYQFDFNEALNFQGEEILKNKVNDLKRLQEYVGDEIPIITIIAPTKAHFYKDKLPARNQTTSQKTNYNYLLKNLPKAGLRVIDFNALFLQKKYENIPALFARGGIHWTHYGASLAMDSLMQYISTVKNIEYDRYNYKTFDCSGFNVDDLDIALLRNLILKPKDDALKGVSYSANPKKRKLKAMIIGDSFFQTVQNSEMRKLIFSKDTEYHYYFNTTFDANYNSNNIDIQKISKQLKEVDCIIILSDIVNLENFGFGFPQAMIKELTIE